MIFRAIGVAITMAFLLFPAAAGAGGSSEGAVSACQRHVSRLLHSAVTTDFSGLRTSAIGEGKVEIAEKVHTVDEGGREQIGDYVCQATRYSSKIWGTKTSLRLR